MEKQSSEEKLSGGPTHFLAARDWLPLFILILAAFCIWVLSMPLFPSQDGPNHLFDAVIFGKLLAHSSPLYAHYYYVRYLFPPYSFHYYLLLILLKFVPPLLADQFVICLILILFSFGFRFLAKGIGSTGGVLSLFIFTIVLDWPLAMGFENFCLALAFDLWALGLWVRFTGSSKLGSRVLFFALCCVIVLTHPVALPLLFTFCGLDLALRFFSYDRLENSTKKFWSHHLADIVTLLLSSCLVFYVFAFTDHHKTASNLHSHFESAWTIPTYLSMYGLAFFGKHGFLNLFYRLLLAVTLCVGLVLAFTSFHKQWRAREWRSAESFLVIACLLVLLLPLVPNTVNNAYYFAVRLLVVLWIGALAAGSGHARLLPRSQNALALAASAFAAYIIGLAVLHVTPTAYRIAAIMTEPIKNIGKVGLYIPAYDGADYTYPTYYSHSFEWAGSHYFRENNAIMLNAPWMDSTYLPIGPTPALLTDKVNFGFLQEPIEFRRELIRNKALQGLVFPRVDFIFFTDPDHWTTPSSMAEIFQLDPSDHWSCHTNDWYTLCEKKPPASPQ